MKQAEAKGDKSTAVFPPAPSKEPNNTADFFHHSRSTKQFHGGKSGQPARKQRRSGGRLMGRAVLQRVHTQQERQHLRESWSAAWPPQRRKVGSARAQVHCCKNQHKKRVEDRGINKPLPCRKQAGHFDGDVACSANHPRVVWLHSLQKSTQRDKRVAAGRLWTCEAGSSTTKNSQT